MLKASFGFLSAVMLLIAEGSRVQTVDNPLKLLNPRMKRQWKSYLRITTNTDPHKTLFGRLFQKEENKSPVKMNYFYIPSDYEFLDAFSPGN